MKNLVIHYKNQKQRDPEMLQMSVYYWTKNLNTIEKIYIVGRYDDDDIEEIRALELPRIFPNIEILSVPVPEAVQKDFKINFQLIMASKHVETPFISAHIDVFPIKKIKSVHMNKEYQIKGVMSEYTPSYAFENLQLETAKFIKEKYELDDVNIYYNHYFYLITKDFIDFLKPYWDKYNYPAMLTYYNQYSLGKDVFKSNLINVSHYKNKESWDNDAKKYYGINITLPSKFPYFNKYYKPIKEIIDDKSN